MRISVVMPCYNSSDHIVESLQSALDQTHRPLEILCVDDASTDDTFAILKRLARQYDGLVRPLRRRSNGGPAAARNLAIAAAKGDWIAFLDHDDLWLPDKLERQVDFARRNPGVDLIHSDAWIENDRDAATRRLAHDGRHVPDGDPFATLFYRCFVALLTVVVRRERIESVGGWREDLPSSADYDLWLRLARAGCRFGHIDEPLAVWRKLGGGMTDDASRMARGDLALLDRLVRDDPAAVRIIGARGVRSRLLALRLRVAHQLARDGRIAEAREELRRVWHAGRLEPRVWGLRLAQAHGRLDHPRSLRRIKHVGRRFRERGRHALAQQKRAAQAADTPG